MEQQKRVRAEVKLPLILIHTPFGLTFFDKVAKTSAARAYARLNTYIMPLITTLAIFLIIGSLLVLFSNSAAREGVRGAGPQANLLIPGLNPYLPITYGWVALVVTIIIHEAGHGIVARVHNIKVESTGIVLILGLPIGAFVNIERDELARASLKHKSAIMTAGPFNNMVLAGLSLLALYLVVSTLTPIPPAPGIPKFAVMVVSVNEGSLAQSIGITPGSTIVSVAGQQLQQLEDLSNILRAHLGSTIPITWQDHGKNITKEVTLPPSVEQGHAVLGVGVTPVTSDPGVVLDRYKAAFSQNPLAILLPPTMQQGSVPYSDLMAPKYVSTLGPAFPAIANILFWLWFINFNVGIFNALPIGPLDGGQLYGNIIESKARSKTIAKNANTILTVVMVIIVLASLVLPYVFF